MRTGLLAVAAVVVVLCGVSAAQATHEEGIEPPVAGRAPDSAAPPNSAPHWLPPDGWIHVHWIPFDERRLYQLLRSNRAELWSWLRHDVQTLAELGRQRGWPDPQRLAAALVAPRAKHVSAAKLRTLRRRAYQIVDQGHLAQHLLLHMLHQEVGPRHAPHLFGVHDTAAFQAQRRLDLSPLRIGRQQGRTRWQMQRALEHELRAAAREGVSNGDTSARQAQTVLQRQLRQVPRWLGEDHYNGPPQTVRGSLRFPFRPSFASPVLSADGRMVLFDGQQAAPPVAVRYGEVVLEGRDLDTGVQIGPRDASQQALLDRPCSSYDPSVSGDGRFVAYEMAAGNRTFAKRYGNVTIALADLRSQTVRSVTGEPRRDGRVETAYDPVLSSDGSVVAYESVTADPMSPGARWSTQVHVRNVATGATTVIQRVGGAYEATLSGDGRRVAYTAFVGSRLQVFVRDLSSGRTTLASRLPDGSRAAEASEPSLSRDGRRVAFTATAGRSQRARVYVRDIRRSRAVVVSGPGTHYAAEPSISADGARVAYAEQPRGARPSALGRPGQRIIIRGVGGAGAAHVASLSATGATLRGWSAQPALSGDGRRVAFTTDAPTDPRGGPGGLQILVRDLQARTTTTANAPAPLASFDGGPFALQPMSGPLCSLAPPVW